MNWCRIRNCVINDQIKIACYSSCDDVWSAYQTLSRWLLHNDSSRLFTIQSVDIVSQWLTLSIFCIWDNDCHKAIANPLWNLANPLWSLRICKATVYDWNTRSNASAIVVSLPSWTPAMSISIIEGCLITQNAPSICFRSRCDLINDFASIAHIYDFMNILKARFSTRLANGYLHTHVLGLFKWHQSYKTLRLCTSQDLHT